MECGDPIALTESVAWVSCESLSAVARESPGKINASASVKTGLRMTFVQIQFTKLTWRNRYGQRRLRGWRADWLKQRCLLRVVLWQFNANEKTTWNFSKHIHYREEKTFHLGTDSWLKLRFSLAYPRPSTDPLLLHISFRLSANYNDDRLGYNWCHVI